MARGETERQLKKPQPPPQVAGQEANALRLPAVTSARRIALLILLLGSVGTARAAVSMDQAVRLVEQRFHARVVKAETQKDNGRTVYVLKLLSDSTGKVWTVRVDAASGAVQ